MIWAATEWETEERHNDAAQMIMKSRRDDRIAAIRFGPEPYFEIFAEELPDFRIGTFHKSLEIVVVGHGLIADGAGQDFLNRRAALWSEAPIDDIAWLRLYHNSHHRDEFVFFWGFEDTAAFDAHYEEEHPLEEKLFAGLEAPLEMAPMAAYNQFVCVPLDITKATSAVN